MLIQKQNYMLSKTPSKKGVNNDTEAAGEFIRNKISDEILKRKPVTDQISRNVRKKLFHQEKGRKY